MNNVVQLRRSLTNGKHCNTLFSRGYALRREGDGVIMTVMYKGLEHRKLSDYSLIGNRALSGGRTPIGVALFSFATASQLDRKSTVYQTRRAICRVKCLHVLIITASES